jgi:hypothetical protein
MMHRLWLLFIAGLCLLLGAEPALAQPEREVDQEVTLTSRELVERLVRVEEGQKALAQRLEGVNTGLNQRIDDLRVEMSGRIEDLRVEMSGRINDTNKRIDDLRVDMNNRFNDVMTMLQIIVSTLVALVLAIAGAGFIMWRKILAVDAAVQTKVGLDEAVREQVGRLERDMGFLQGKVKELGEALEKR